MSDFYSEFELSNLGLRSYGNNVLVSKDTKIIDFSRLELGDNVRIDPYCIFTFGETGYIKIGSNVHVADKVRIVGAGGVEIMNFANIGIGSTILSCSDDYSGDFMMGPMAPSDSTNLNIKKIILAEYSVVATQSVLFPGSDLGEGSVLGAMSLAHRPLKPWTVYFGIPAVPIKKRSKGMTKFKNV